MTSPTPGSNLGRYVFGSAALASGLVTLAWHDNNHPYLLRYVEYAASAGLMAGGAGILFRQTAKMGAVILVAASIVFALLCVPGIVSAPQTYNSWGNFFEQLSLVTGAGMVYSRLLLTGSGKVSGIGSRGMLHRTGRILLGICAASFALEQAFYLSATAHLVPKWLPPSQVFWAVATTIAFLVASAALLTNLMALLAARLLTVMIVSFGLLVWLPLILAGPRSHTNWSETAETFEIAGAVWILADLLGDYRRDEYRPR